jgi:hypothetical protein
MDALGDCQTSHTLSRVLKPTIVVIEILDHLHPTSIRVARALARPESANLFLCHWHRLDFSGDKVAIQGTVHQVISGGMVHRSSITNPLPVDALFFYGPDSAELTERDTPKLERLAAADIAVSGVPIYIIVDRMMLKASGRGVVTNALGSGRSWGPKHAQELKLRRYESATGEVIVRPKTYIARPHELRSVLARFSARGETCIVKPAFGEGGRGLSIVRRGDSFPQSNCTVVVQQLIADPLLVDGHKADIRFYLLIDVDDQRSSGRLQPVFVRRAAEPYRAQSLCAEITNTSYRVRRGLPPDIRPLALTPGISRELHTEIVSQLDSLANLLVKAYFWNAAQKLANDAWPSVPNRLMLFGIDVLVAAPSTVPQLYFLETNPFPALFRGSLECDQAVDEMLSREYLPVLIRSRSAAAAYPRYDN